MAEQGDWIYYVNWDDNYCLYKIRTDGSNKTKVNNDSTGHFRIVGDWIYYEHRDDDWCLYRIRTDGTGPHQNLQ